MCEKWLLNIKKRELDGLCEQVALYTILAFDYMAQ
jgi:hypothetical protein